MDAVKFIISIHAPREGGDILINPQCADDYIFQSTPPARGATHGRAGVVSHSGDFNPRPPRGGRRWIVAILAITAYFNPRPPRGGRRRSGGCWW